MNSNSFIEEIENLLNNYSRNKNFRIESIFIYYNDESDIDGIDLQTKKRYIKPYENPELIK